MLEDKSIQLNHFQFNNPIKRIEVDPLAREIIIVEALSKNMKVHRIMPNTNNSIHVIIDLNSEKYVLEKANNHYLVFSEIIDPSKSNEREIKIFDLYKKTFILSVKGKRFVGFVSGNEIQVESMEFLSLKSERIMLDSERESVQDITAMKIFAPDLYFGQSEYFESIKSHLNEIFKMQIEAPIEILEYNENLFLGVHTNESGLKDKYLAILDFDGSLIYKKSMYQKLEKAIPDSFFVFNEFLIFVSEFRTLNLIPLNFSNAS